MAMDADLAHNVNIVLRNHSPPRLRRSQLERAYKGMFKADLKEISRHYGYSGSISGLLIAYGFKLDGSGYVYNPGHEREDSLVSQRVESKFHQHMPSKHEIKASYRLTGANTEPLPIRRLHVNPEARQNQSEVRQHTPSIREYPKDSGELFRRTPDVGNLARESHEPDARKIEPKIVDQVARFCIQSSEAEVVEQVARPRVQSSEAEIVEQVARLRVQIPEPEVIEQAVHPRVENSVAHKFDQSRLDNLLKQCWSDKELVLIKPLAQFVAIKVGTKNREQLVDTLRECEILLDEAAVPDVLPYDVLFAGVDEYLVGHFVDIPHSKKLMLEIVRDRTFA